MKSTEPPEDEESIDPDRIDRFVAQTAEFLCTEEEAAALPRGVPPLPPILDEQPSPSPRTDRFVSGREVEVFSEAECAKLPRGVPPLPPIQ